MVIFYYLLPVLLYITQGFVIKCPIFVSSIDLSIPLLLLETKTVEFQGYSTKYQEKLAKKPKSEVAILFIHGFASSSYHWRYNIPSLSENYDTYAIDLIGFGFSAKPKDILYTVPLWCDQVTEFIDRVIQKPCILVGNSLGGYIALYAASSPVYNKKIRGIITINPVIISRSNPKVRLPQIFGWFASKSVIKGYFHLMKQQQSIRYFFRMLYPIFPDRVDDLLIDSIEYPSKNTNASDVFYGIVKENIMNPTIFIEDIVENLDSKIPISIIYGTKDPWISPYTIDYFIKLLPKTILFEVSAGHCPQDEIPEIINIIIESFMTNL
jgi:pimeloyl-ACP methyl ester carboxylesterase